MMKRRAFLGGTLSAVTVGSGKAQSATAIAQNAVIQAPPEPLVWPVVAKLQPGIRSFAGHTDTVPDIVGRIGTPPSLVIFTEGNRELIIVMAARHRLPAAYAFRHFVTDGGLISYGIDLADQYRQAAAYVDRILRGEKPGELPIQQPTKFELVLNLKTAKALGLDVQWFLQQRADEVIE